MARTPPLLRQVLDAQGKNWSKGSLTRKKLLANIKEFAKFVQVKFGLERIQNLKPRHVEAYVDALHTRGLSASTIADKLTAVRSIAQGIGKQNIVHRHNADYGIRRVRINPQPVDSGKLSEIRMKLHAQAAEGDRVAKMMFAADALREAFGLRAKESLMTNDVVKRDDKTYITVEGAKGGRVRHLEIDNENKRYAADLVVRTSREIGSSTGRIVLPGMTLKEAYDIQRNRWRKLGGTRKNAANMHSRRHSYARELNDSGATRQEIMAELGHGQNRSPSAYIPKPS